MMQLALYQPDIALNVGASIRLCACLNVNLHIIEPCGFPWDEKKIRKSALDYIEHLTINRYSSWEKFIDQNQGRSRIVLLTTKADKSYTDFKFESGDIILMGRESAGVPNEVHQTADHRIIIPMKSECRSINVVNSAAIVLGEALRQTGF